jgi:hypothetical protein
MTATSAARHAWIESATAALRERFAEIGHAVPAKVRVSIGWPKGSHGKGRAIGQCWSSEASSDAHHEIFVSPELRDSVKIFGVLAHELAHAIVGTKAGHKAPFKRVAEAVGLVGRMTATEESVAFIAWSQGHIAKLGKYPAGALALNMRKKQSTRLLKCECEGCGYTVRITRKWLDAGGSPICPTDQEPMACDAIDDE